MHGLETIVVRPELGPQPAHVGVHGAAVAHVAVAPDVVEQTFAGQYLAAFFHEGHEEFELDGGQIEFAPDQPHFKSCAVEREGTNFQLLARARSARFFDEQAEPEDEFARAEGFGQVIVSAQFESGHAVLGAGFGREHDDRNPGGDFARAQLTANVFAPHFRDHQIKDYGGRQFFAGQFQAGQAVGSFDHGKAFFAQMQTDQVEDVGLILDDQYNFFRGLFGGHASLGAR